MPLDDTGPRDHSAGPEDDIDFVNAIIAFVNARAGSRSVELVAASAQIAAAALTVTALTSGYAQRAGLADVLQAAETFAMALKRCNDGCVIR